ncbi:hypothetical protein BCR33DRAFT_717244 [Rhizoclosmatium globosum]|uniref:Uncharacterized protein n=1 Tax=Rhizoclosmatium globosum TaxID=329046 RepID=A0A1Y2CAV5_9FUNG|nr:hypothetical protein BCR33DRAFT_717244 [Rhizoclosmatium globosum]|eukprot:ORY44168.1 hypothetical protein BCR33DRAFT_717244 [Rhizoclosmatium globosum]
MPVKPRSAFSANSLIISSSVGDCRYSIPNRVEMEAQNSGFMSMEQPIQTSLTFHANKNSALTNFEVFINKVCRQAVTEDPPRCTDLLQS